jgi:hypothetical protein
LDWIGLDWIGLDVMQCDVMWCDLDKVDLIQHKQAKSREIRQAKGKLFPTRRHENKQAATKTKCRHKYTSPIVLSQVTTTNTFNRLIVVVIAVVFVCLAVNY